MGPLTLRGGSLSPPLSLRGGRACALKRFGAQAGGVIIGRKMSNIRVIIRHLNSYIHSYERKAAMNKNNTFVDRRFHPQLRQFVRFEFIAYIILHLYTCYVIFSDYGLMFAIIAAICPVIPEIYMFVMGIFAKEFIYIAVFLVFVASVIVNAIVINWKTRSK